MSNLNNDKYYNTKRWEQLRAKALRRDKYQCQLSRRYGKIRQATVVHHIFPREQFPEYQWELWNLISLSNEAHDRMHDRTTHRLTDEGKKLLEKTARQRGIELFI